MGDSVENENMGRRSAIRRIVGVTLGVAAGAIAASQVLDKLEQDKLGANVV